MKCEYLKESDQISGQCICPKYFNEDNDGFCVPCFEPNFWIKDIKRCQKCPDTKIYNLLTQSCICPLGYYEDYSNACIQCLPPSIWNNITKECKN